MRKILIVGLLSLFFVGCSSFASEHQQPRKRVHFACAGPRLESGFKFHNRARDYLKAYYLTRKASDLYFAWYASEDSQYMAMTIAKCHDKRNKHFHAMQNLLHKNRVLRKLIAQNMRIDSQAEVSELFLDDYRQIFVRDIQ